MKTTTRFFVAASLLLALAAPAHASPQVVRTSFTVSGVYAGQRIAHIYQDYILPKFPSNPSTGSGFEQNSPQINSSDGHFAYFHILRVCLVHIGGCIEQYEIEATYNDATGLHEGFLLDYGFPGDVIDAFYDETGGSGRSMRIVNNGASGHGSWDHTSTFTWSGTVPDSYNEPHFIFNVDPFGFGHNCLGDMPAQDTPGSSSHVGTLYYLGAIWLADGTLISMPLLAVNPAVTTVSPTSCSIGLSTGTYGPYTYYTMTWYAGG